MARFAVAFCSRAFLLFPHPALTHILYKLLPTMTFQIKSVIVATVVCVILPPPARPPPPPPPRALPAPPVRGRASRVPLHPSVSAALPNFPRAARSRPRPLPTRGGRGTTYLEAARIHRRLPRGPPPPPPPPPPFREGERFDDNSPDNSPFPLPSVRFRPHLTQRRRPGRRLQEQPPLVEDLVGQVPDVRQGQDELQLVQVG